MDFRRSANLYFSIVKSSYLAYVPTRAVRENSKVEHEVQSEASYYIIHPRRFARNASYERSCFWWIRPRRTQKSRRSSSSTPHLMGHGPGRPVKTRGRSHGHGGLRSLVAVVHLILWAALRAGRQNTVCLAEGHIWVTYKAHTSWAAVRPGQPFFQKFHPGPAQTIGP